MNPKNVAIAVLLLGLSMSPASQAESSHSTKDLPGTFIETVNFQGSTFKVLVSFTRDGRSTVLLPFGPPAPGSGDTRVGGLGEWIRTGRREFAGTEFFFASQGYGDTAAVPLQRSIFKLTLDEDGDSFSGPFRYEVIDTNGNVLFSGDGTFSGKRLNVVPLD